MSDETLTEFGLIERLTRNLSTARDVIEGVGDDCAILDLHNNDLLLATCDSQVEGVHFTLDTSSAEQIGQKALAINLSDIAAMGGTPRYALISLVLPKHIQAAWLERLYEGLHEEAKRSATTIVGGNIAGTGTAEQLIIDITLLGTVKRGHAITRSGAHVGDRLCVTGTLGDSAAGLFTLFNSSTPYPQEACHYVRARCRTPQPRIHEGQILGSFGPQIVTAMLDISDGLSGDAAHICERSHVGIIIDAASLPISTFARKIATSAGRNPLDWALHGGEDYELLFTVAPGHEESVINAVQQATGTPVTPIGTITTAETGITLVNLDGQKEALISRSWDHLRM